MQEKSFANFIKRAHLFAMSRGAFSREISPNARDLTENSMRGAYVPRLKQIDPVGYCGWSLFRENRELIVARCARQRVQKLSTRFQTEGKNRNW